MLARCFEIVDKRYSAYPGCYYIILFSSSEPRSDDLEMRQISKMSSVMKVTLTNEFLLNYVHRKWEAAAAFRFNYQVTSQDSL